MAMARPARYRKTLWARCLHWFWSGFILLLWPAAKLMELIEKSKTDR